MASVSKPIFSVQVRELVEFALRTGDLGGSGEFVGRDRASAGTRGHQRVQRSRPVGYEKEVRLVHEIDAGDFVLRLQGRIDGLLVTEGEVLLEEIKTVQAKWDKVADPLHWAQAKIYGAIYALDHALDHIHLRLTYLDLDSEDLTEFTQTYSRAELSDFLAHATAIYLEWLRAYERWRRLRNQSMESFQFPFPRYRAGQREMAVTVYRTVANGGRLFIEAPTGIGKTVSALFPTIKALGEGKVGRIFYLTARTTGRMVAEKALADLRRARLRTRSLTLTAKEKICVQQGQPCDRQTCPLARGYYDRVKPAMQQALAAEEITRPVIEAVAAQYQVCPFELSLDVSLWVDIVVCDYNYVFDPQVYLRRHFAEENADHAVLIDEAHNLVDRSREMFSADLNSAEMNRLKPRLRSSLPRCAKALSRLSSALSNLRHPEPRPAARDEIPESEGELNLFQSAIAGVNAESESSVSGQTPLSSETRNGTYALAQLPGYLLPLIEAVLKEAETWLARNEPAEFRAELLELYFRLYAFLRTAEAYDERYVTLVYPGPVLQVKLFCLAPSFRLRQVLNRTKAAVFFSATLRPLEFYREMLGGAPEDRLLQLASPFPRENLAVLVQDRIRTSFKARSETLPDVVEAIAAVVQERQGNYLVYFPSYQYLTGVRELFQRAYSDTAILVQRPGMSDAERDAFLATFATEPGVTQVGFAVMGGVFGEGVDLVGDRLIGAIIVGVGLPQLCVERDLIREYFQAKTGAGFDYAYAYPGLNRVLQAAGRVIRSETDRGIVLLIDTRFGEPRYWQLLPAWWQRAIVRNPAATRLAAHQFWESTTN